MEQYERAKISEVLLNLEKSPNFFNDVAIIQARNELRSLLAHFLYE